MTFVVLTEVSGGVTTSRDVTQLSLTENYQHAHVIAASLFRVEDVEQPNKSLVYL